MPANDILKHPDIENIREQFASLVQHGEPDECWPWLGAVDPNNYGLCFLGKTRDRAHRVAYALANGPIGRWSAKRSLSICHECDNPICCNPKHLFEGTDADNVADMVAKGRIQRGEKHYAAKLTEAQVIAIRADRRSDRLVALDYGVSKGTISSVRIPGSWPSLGPVEPIPNRHAEVVARGEDSGAAKLTTEQVLAIRADPRPYCDIAATYGVTESGIMAIKYRETWKHLPPRDIDVPSSRKPSPTGDDRKRKVTRDIREAILVSSEKPVSLAARYGISLGSVYMVRNSGGRGKGLAVLRRAVEALIASREEMDEGWFIPSAAMQALEVAVKKGPTE